MHLITDKINKKIEELLNDKVISSTTPPQGMDSCVLFITTESGKEYAVKYSDKGFNGDINALHVIAQNKVAIPVPDLIANFLIDDTTVLVLEKINYPLLDSLQPKEMAKYIPSMIDNLKKIHTIKSEYCGLLANNPLEKDWKKVLLSIFEYRDCGVDWEEVLQRDGLDKDLVKEALKNIIRKIKETDFDNTEFSLIHTDFNQRNLFIDTESNQITGIIDWSESMYGDPLLDFGRVRMYIWHFGLEDQILDEYNKLVAFTPEQKNLEELYWLVRIIEYLAYYSEKLDEFNTGRIKLHQDFLRLYNWKSN